MHFRKVTPKIALFVVMLGLFMPSAIFADDFKKDPVTVSLTDPIDNSGNLFAVDVSVASVEHRKATFVVNNDSLRPIRHELIVIRTDLPPGELPLDADGRVDESQVEIVGRTSVLEGDLLSETLTLKLKKGNYALICNIGSHYGRGMYTGFRVGKEKGDD